jgi:hypothetical protein
MPGIPVLPQAAVFSLYKYTEPLNWKTELRKGMVVYSDINQNEGTYGQIGIYESRASSNDPENEFRKDWNELIAAAYSVTGMPTIRVTNLDNYWKIAQATVQTSRNGQSFTLKMINFTGLGNTATIITTYVGDKYKLRIDEFISSVEMAGPENIQSYIGQVYKKVNKPVENKTLTQSTILANESSSKGRNMSYGNLTYNLPAGWDQIVKNNYLSVFPARLYQGEAIEIRLLNPVNTSDFQAAAGESWQEITRSWKEDFYNDLFPGQIRNSLSGFQYYYERKNTRRMNGLDSEIDLYLFSNGNRIERCIVISDEFRVQGLDYFASTRFFEDINNFVYSIRVTGNPEAASNIPATEGGNITGVWAGMAGGFSGYTGTYDQKPFYAVFYNNGIVYFRDRLPDHGLYQLNPFIWQNVYPDYWCTYSFAGDKGLIKSRYYSDMPLLLAGNKLTITKRGLDHSFTRLLSPDGMKLNGTWTFESGETISFNSDGTFTDNGALAILEHSLYYKPYTVTANPGSGRYDIRNFTAIFTYPDGREFRCAFPAFDIDRNNPSPAVLVFGRDDFLRLK